MEQRHIDWEPIGLLTNYLFTLAAGSIDYGHATEQDRETARRVEHSLTEQSQQYGDPDTGTFLDPKWDGKATVYVLDVADWEFCERWFTDPQRMGRWAMERIGEPVP